VQVCTFKGMSDATVKLINEEFVPLAINGGRFGEILTARGEIVTEALISGDTFGPDGRNNPLAPKRLKEALEKFKLLPPEKRKASTEESSGFWKDKTRPYPQPPVEGLILRQYRRAIHRDADGQMHRQALYHDFLWMTKAEWQSLVPEQRRAGESFAAPDFLVSRIALHHAQVVASACGLKLSDMPKPVLTLTVEEGSPDQLRLQLQGTFKVIEHNDSLINGIADYQICGCLHYDTRKKTFTRFDLAALGEVTNRRKDVIVPEGRTYVGGWMFELSPGDTPWERTPPGRLAFGGGGPTGPLHNYFKTGK
jgi:hypothetical protein